MKVMLEKEARECFCPFKDVPHAIPSAVKPNCQASKCMAWVKTGEDKGYCFLLKDMKSP